MQLSLAMIDLLSCSSSRGSIITDVFCPRDFADNGTESRRLQHRFGTDAKGSSLHALILCTSTCSLYHFLFVISALVPSRTWNFLVWSHIDLRKRRTHGETAYFHTLGVILFPTIANSSLSLYCFTFKKLWIFYQH